MRRLIWLLIRWLIRWFLWRLVQWIRRRFGRWLGRVCILLVVIWAAAAGAVESRGARSCANWQEGRLEEKIGYSRKAEIDQTWLVGYMSGLVAGSVLDFFAGTDNRALFGLVDAYCVATPTGNLATAGVAVARQLMQEKGLVYRGTMP